jgi:hypothetical protein
MCACPQSPTAASATVQRVDDRAALSQDNTIQDTFIGAAAAVAAEMATEHSAPTDYHLPVASQQQHIKQMQTLLSLGEVIRFCFFTNNNSCCFLTEFQIVQFPQESNLSLYVYASNNGQKSKWHHVRVSQKIIKNCPYFSLQHFEDVGGGLLQYTYLCVVSVILLKTRVLI